MTTRSRNVLLAVALAGVVLGSSNARADDACVSSCLRTCGAECGSDLNKSPTERAICRANCERDNDACRAGCVRQGNPPTPVDIVGMANVDGDTSRRMDVVGVGRPGTPKAGHVFVGISTGNQVPSWTWESSVRMIDDGAHVWLGDVDGDGKADLVSQGGAGGAAAGWVVVGLSNGSGFAHWSWTSGHRMLDDNSKSWLADVDGDGKVDLVSQGGSDGPAEGWLVVGLSNGSGFAHWSWISGHPMLDH